jgi:hypothetical protein
MIQGFDHLQELQSAETVGTGTLGQDSAVSNLTLTTVRRLTVMEIHAFWWCFAKKN